MTDEEVAILASSIQATGQRLARLESMLCYLMSQQVMTETVQPNKDQAQRLITMGLPPWEKVTRQVTLFEQWRERYEAKFKSQVSVTLKGEDGKET